MKKSLVLVLVVSMLLSVLSFSASALTFTDLEASHWAYENVQTLVADGTVSGYEDGSFRPNGSVTRAEFVKMLGKSDVTRPRDYSDVSSAHWAYSYIMNANFPEDDTNMFFPDIPITRGLVAELLWIRGGRVNDAFAPAIITSQYKKAPQAVAWVYATGLIKGDDGVNLRLNDTLSRAEAATLIVRSRNAKAANVTFNETVSPKILENVYYGLNLFDNKTYDPNATITNGEMARAALRIGGEAHTLSYFGLNASKAFDHQYALDLAVISQYIGAEKNTPEFIEKAATFGDTVTALVHQYFTKAKKTLVYGSTTESLSGKVTNMANICLTYAKNNGIITLKEDLDAPINLHDFTVICLLLDDVIGSQTDITSEVNTVTGNYIKKDHSLFMTEAPYGDFRVKLEDMPSVLYSTPFKTKVSAPVESYDFAREYSSIFTSFLQSLKDSVKELGADVRFTYYPSLVCDNGNGYTIRIACEVVEMSGSKAFSDLFAIDDNMEKADTQLSKGSLVYFDLATGEPFKSVYATAENAYVEQIVFVK
ncbi:MAG: S-layer homology domain-containing protein [Ruminococcaceae bacterium]|nr:S-layer homology domain-containing protein [Oscillospiraceae bacterium]